jgi:hypothetical protein
MGSSSPVEMEAQTKTEELLQVTPSKGCIGAISSTDQSLVGLIRSSVDGT